MANKQNLNIPFADDDIVEEHLLSKSDLSTIESDDSCSTPPPTIPMRKPSLGERRNIKLNTLRIPSNQKSKISNANDTIYGTSDEDDSPRPLEESIGRKRSLRRNSISLPMGLNTIDLEAIHRQQVEKQIADNMKYEDTESVVVSVTEPESVVSRSPIDSPSSESDIDDKPIIKRTGFRTIRRSSIAPLPSIRLNDKEMLANELDGQSIISNQNSITSVSSLASLLKEKLQSFPSKIRKKKSVSGDFKIKAFVSILSLIIVFLVGYAYIMYNYKVLGRLYFNTVKINKVKRTMEIYDYSNQKTFVKANLGKRIESTVKNFVCLPENQLNDGSVCLEWDTKARVYLYYEQDGPIDCYKIKWQALDEGIYPTDCYDISLNNNDDKNHWYGGGLIKQEQWPLERSSFDFSPFITGDGYIQQFGNALKRYFISSGGVAIQIDDNIPLHVSMNYNNSKQLCLKSMNDKFAFINKHTELEELNYKICILTNIGQTNDMKILHQKVTQQSLWDGIKESHITAIHSILEEPIWQIPSFKTKDQLTESIIYNFTEKVIDLGFLRLGHVLINEFWQNEIGDFTIDKSRFPTLDDTFDMLHRRGFKIVFSFQPFISTESINFAEVVQKKLLIFERLSNKSVPAMTRYKSSVSAGVLDITNNKVFPWLMTKLKNVTDTYGIDSFFVDYGNAYNIPQYYQCDRPLLNPDQYKTFFTNSLLEGEVDIIGVSGAIDVPKPPVFLGLPPANSSWEGLQSVLTTTLTYGILGYPFLLTGSIGGDFYTTWNGTDEAIKPLSFYSLESAPLPDPELYIRWLQLATFLPTVRYTHLPSDFKDSTIMDIAKELTAIRQKTVLPLLKKYLNDALKDGLPFVRPLWMLETQDTASMYVNDEFSIGEELIVAPILNKGQLKREVYLPHGVWKDGVDGSLRKGSRWIHNYRVPKDKVAYFVKMPDNTRF